MMQNIDDKGLPYLVTVNPPRTPEKMLLKWITGHLIPSVAATKASLEFYCIQGKRGIWLLEKHDDEIVALEVWEYGRLYEHVAAEKIPLFIRLFSLLCW